MGMKWHVVAVLGVAGTVAAADRGLSFAGAVPPPEEASYLRKLASSLWQSDGTAYHHLWPVIIEAPLVC
jgi:hypothetical protein